MRSRSLRRRLLLGAVAAAVALLVVGYVAVYRGSSDDRQVRIVIPPGSGFGAAADSLGHAGVVSLPRLFRIYATVLGRDDELKAGTYQLRRGAGWGEALDAVTRGRGLVQMVTIPEGFALSSIVPRLARVLGVPPESVAVAAADTALLHRLDIPTPTLEGYLFPDTYAFGPGTGARTAVRLMVERFERAWKPEWDARLQALAMTRHDVLTLASIIEKEARVPEERPVISAVYHNRLKAGMLLQADPTVQYAHGRHVERVLYKDLEIDSRYNTYRYPGLPPGPIASPGAPSIQAALFPADVPYLYFVAHPDGHHEFRRTFREHSRVARDMRRIRDSLAKRPAIR